MYELTVDQMGLVVEYVPEGYWCSLVTLLQKPVLRHCCALAFKTNKVREKVMMRFIAPEFFWDDEGTKIKGKVTHALPAKRDGLSRAYCHSQ
jgi:hypothetical protein